MCIGWGQGIAAIASTAKTASQDRATTSSRSVRPICIRSSSARCPVRRRIVQDADHATPCADRTPGGRVLQSRRPFRAARCRDDASATTARPGRPCPIEEREPRRWTLGRGAPRMSYPPSRARSTPEMANSTVPMMSTTKNHGWPQRSTVSHFVRPGSSRRRAVRLSLTSDLAGGLPGDRGLLVGHDRRLTGTGGGGRQGPERAAE
jgi:hypothetical protein